MLYVVLNETVVPEMLLGRVNNRIREAWVLTHRNSRRKGTGRRLGLAALALGMLSACAVPGRDSVFDPDLTVRQAPMIAGNTYDRQNALAIIYPSAERINVSYEYSYDAEVEISAPGKFEGPSWVFAERHPALPSRFILLHLNKGAPDYEPPRGETLRLGQRRFYVVDYCMADWRETGDAEIRPYLNTLEARGYALSRDIFVRRFVPRDVDEVGRRTSIVAVRDVMRDGYSCEALGDLRNPSSDFLTETINGFRKDASDSFEIMG